MGCDLVETSAHGGARPTHQVWQGKVFSRSGLSKKYPNFVEETGYGTAAGLAGVNCRHSFYPFYEGISERAYSKAELDGLAHQTVTYQGKEMSLYDATQQQRYIERGIRHWKRRRDGLEAAGQDASHETAKVKEWQARARDFTKQTGLQRQSEREWVGPVGGGRSGELPPKDGVASAVGNPKMGLPDVPAHIDTGEGILMSGQESTPRSVSSPLLNLIQNLSNNDVIKLGDVKTEIVSIWSQNPENNLGIVLTGNRRNHYLDSHPEMRNHEFQLVDIVVHPNEVHYNKEDPMMAIFYKQIDENHFFRVAVLMQPEAGPLSHSIISFRFCGKDEVIDGRKHGRLAWKEE